MDVGSIERQCAVDIQQVIAVRDTAAVAVCEARQDVAVADGESSQVPNRTTASFESHSTVPHLDAGDRNHRVLSHVEDTIAADAVDDRRIDRQTERTGRRIRTDADDLHATRVRDEVEITDRIRDRSRVLTDQPRIACHRRSEGCARCRPQRCTAEVEHIVAIASRFIVRKRQRPTLSRLSEGRRHWRHWSQRGRCEAHRLRTDAGVVVVGHREVAELHSRDVL